jgi:hypothetical protein
VVAIFAPTTRRQNLSGLTLGTVSSGYTPNAIALPSGLVTLKNKTWFHNQKKGAFFSYMFKHSNSYLIASAAHRIAITRQTAGI